MMKKHSHFKLCTPYLAILFSLILFGTSAFCADNPPVGQTRNTGAEIPGGQSKEGTVPQEGIGADIFGDEGGKFHPFVSVEVVYTDNLFLTNENEKEDIITTIAPGLWLALPANRERLLKLSTTPTSPGGLELSRIKPEATRRYQTYFLYSPELVMYADHSEHDHVNHKAEALFQYNLNSGLSFDLIDLFNDREEIAGNGVIDRLYRHKDNLLDFITSYTSSSGKIRLQFNYSNYYINYDETDVSYRDRDDNSFGLSIFYRFWPKTSLFAEYNYSNIDFDTGTINNSEENRYYGGVTWDITAKTRGTFKLGYTEKDFDDESVEDQDDFSVELQTQHNLNPKRSLQINGYRKFHESDLADASSFLSTGISVGLLQRFTDKWTGTLNGFYEQNEYNGYDRDDDYWGFGPALRFEAKKWMIFDLGFYHYTNDSNITVFDYKVNQVFFRGTLSF